MLVVDVKMKDLFFDRAKVIRAVERQERRVMSRSLAFIRQTAKQRILRRRKRVSLPGEAPSVRASGHASLKTIWFAYDMAKSVGVVGPVKLNSNSDIIGDTVPGALERSGSMRVTEEYRPAFRGEKTDGDPRQVKWRQTYSRRKRSGVRRRVRTARIQPRPFMSKALDHEIKKGTIPAAWSNVVTG